jgi:hypothetical protein
MQTTYRCRTCVKYEVGDDRPTGWYRLNVCGTGRPPSDAVHSGLYCSTGCLLVAVMSTYGLSAQQVRDWIAGSDT